MLERQFIFVRNPLDAGKTKFSPLNLQIVQKFTAFNDKRCGRFAVNFFSPLFTANLTLFFNQTSTRVLVLCLFNLISVFANLIQLSLSCGD